MKTIISLLVASSFAFYSMATFAYYKDEVPVQQFSYAPASSCGSDECPDPRYQQGEAANWHLASNDDWDDQYGYERGQPCGACYCTDPGYHWNTCINRSEYCEAFGNVGAR